MSYQPSSQSNYKNPKNTLVQKPFFTSCIDCKNNNKNFVPAFLNNLCMCHYIEKKYPILTKNNPFKKTCDNIEFQKKIEQRYSLGLRISKFYNLMIQEGNYCNYSQSIGWNNVDILSFEISKLDDEINNFIKKYEKENKSINYFTNNFEYNSKFHTCNLNNKSNEHILNISNVFEHITLGGFLKKDDLRDLERYIKHDIFIQYKIEPPYVEYCRKSSKLKDEVKIKIVKYTMKDYFTILNSINKWLNKENNKEKIIYSY